MSGIEITQAVAGSLYLVTITAVAIRLLLLARRTRELPELLFGVSLLVGGTIGSTLEVVGISSLREFGPATAGLLLMAGKAFGLLGFACQGLFLWLVFRPAERWAPFLLAFLLGVLGAAFVGFMAAGSFETGLLPVRWFFFELAGRLAFPTWLMLESVRYWAMMRRRQAIGLADPVIVDRFRLWAGIGGFSVLLLLTSVPPVFLDPVDDEGLLLVDLLLFSIGGVMLSVLNWLAFFPPAWRRRRLEAAAAASA